MKDKQASLWIIALLFAISVAAHAQTSGGSITGSVTDPSGARIAHGTVSVTNIDTGVATVATTNGAGIYSLPNLLPGSYEINASAPGLGSKQISGIVLTVGAAQLLDFSLGISSHSEQVSVSDKSKDLELDSSEISGFVGGETIRSLPLNGRSWFDLAALQPGVTAIQAQVPFQTGTDRGTRGFGSQLTVSGARPQQNNYLLNATSLNDYSNGAGSVLGGNLGVDAISEFTVVTTNAPAQYGRSSGGIINAVTRNGTNAFHGSGYEFARNSTFDARNYFDGPAIPSFSRNQFGGAVGGPILKDRTFFFGNYEGIRQSAGVSGVATVPSQDARNGILHNADGSTTTVAVDPSAAQYLTFWHVPNAGLVAGSDGNIGYYDFSPQQIVQEDFAVGRVDHRISDNDSVFGTYLYDRAPYTYPDSLDTIFYLSKTARQIATLEETHTLSPTIVNTLRIGLNREVVVNDVPATAINPATLDHSLASVPGLYAAQVAVPGLTGFAGGAGASGVNYAWTSYQLGEDLFLNRGRHSIKTGFTFELMRLNVFNRSALNGQFTFTSLAGFLTNQPFVYDAATSSAISPRDLQEMLLGGYAQDDWRITPNLTLNLGLRYEMSTVPHEVRGKLSNLVNLSDATPQLGNPFFQNPTLRNFEPRVGFAFSPLQNHKTVVRGAFGIYDVLPLPYLFILPSTGAAPFTEYGLVFGKLPQGSFYAGAGAYLGPYTLSGVHVQRDPSRSYVMQWNLNVEQELADNLTLLVGYVGNRGIHQPFYANQFNVVLPAVTSSGGYQWPLPIGSGTVINPNYGSIRGFDWDADSYYDAMQVSLRKDLRHGLQFQVSYTQSRSIDETSSSLAPDAFSNSVSTLPFFALSRARGPSDYNANRLLVVSGFGVLPHPHSDQPAVKLLTEGWQLGTILTARDGIPFTPVYGADGDPNGSGGLQDYPDRLTGSGCGSLVNPGNPANYIKTQCFAIPAPGLLGNAGRNILDGPGVLELDSSVFKDILIPKAGDRVKVQFRAEFFNVLNHTNFAIPGTNIFEAAGTPDPTAGLITSTSGTSRQIQFGVKGFF